MSADHSSLNTLGTVFTYNKEECEALKTVVSKYCVITVKKLKQSSQKYPNNTKLHPTSFFKGQFPLSIKSFLKTIYS